MLELRPDRLATLYFFHPLRRLLRWASSGIPILMYHSISEKAEKGRSAYFHTCTTPSAFREQLKLLSECGYKVIGLAEAVRELSGPRTTDKLVVLTFDDGFEDFYTEAFPILSTFGYSATVFPAHRLYRREKPLRLQRKKLSDLVPGSGKTREAGIEFGSHLQVTHPQLRRLSAANIERELRASKEEIQDRLGRPVTSFSYPYAFPEPDQDFRRRLQGRDILVQAEYKNGVSTILGTADSASDRRCFWSGFLLIWATTTHSSRPN